MHPDTEARNAEAEAFRRHVFLQNSLLATIVTQGRLVQPGLLEIAWEDLMCALALFDDCATSPSADDHELYLLIDDLNTYDCTAGLQGVVPPFRGRFALTSDGYLQFALHIEAASWPPERPPRS